SKFGYCDLTNSPMRRSIVSVAADWKPELPSTSGSITSGSLATLRDAVAASRFAFLKRWLAANRTASLNGMIGGAGGGAAGAAAGGAAAIATGADAAGGAAAIAAAAGLTAAGASTGVAALTGVAAGAGGVTGAPALVLTGATGTAQPASQTVAT